MPKKQKIKLGDVLGSLNTVCPKCGCSIPPAQVRRIDFERIECPACGERFTPAKPTQRP
jgi:ribosomal protein S27AE